MRVAVLHPFVDEDGAWVDTFAPAGTLYEFYRVPPVEQEQSWHTRGAKTGLAEWRNHLAHAGRAFDGAPDVIVTNFPQLALAAAIKKTTSKAKPQIVGWTYNVGDVGSPLKGKLAGLFLRQVDRLIVHSREEIGRYAAWHSLPEELFRFVPLQKGELERAEPDESEPFAVSMGSAGRDYKTLFEAAAGFDGKLIVVAKPDAVEGLSLPSNVELRNGLTLQECEALNARARFSIVPVSNMTTASGQVTFLTSMALGCPVIATDCPGTRDYLADGDGAIIVPPFDADALREGMNRLWRDQTGCRALGEAAFRVWNENFSDPVAGRNLVETLNEVTSSARRP